MEISRSRRTRGDRSPSPAQKSFHVSTTPTTRGRKRRFPGSIPPRRVWKPQLLWAIADWLGLSQRTAGLAPRANAEVPPHTGRISCHPQIIRSEILPYVYNSNNPGTKTQIPRVDTAPRGVETPTPLAGC